MTSIRSSSTPAFRAGPAILVLACGLLSLPAAHADIWEDCNLEALWASYLENAKEAARFYDRAAGIYDSKAKGYAQALDAAVDEAAGLGLDAALHGAGKVPKVKAKLEGWKNSKTLKVCKFLGRAMNVIGKMDNAATAIAGLQGQGVLSAMAKANKMEGDAAWAKAQRDLQRYRECCEEADDPTPPGDSGDDPIPPAATPSPITGASPKPTRLPRPPTPPPATRYVFTPTPTPPRDSALAPTRIPTPLPSRRVRPPPTPTPPATRVLLTPTPTPLRDSRLAPTRVPTPMPTRRPAGTGTPDQDSLERAERRIREFLDAYQDGDLGGIRRHLAPGFSQDKGILENAVREELGQQNDIRVEAFPGPVVSGPEGLSVRFRWTRTATDSQTGNSDGTSGEATFFLDRSADLRIDRMIGPLPFGVRNQDLVDQTGGKRAVDTRTRQPVVCGPQAGSGSSR